MPTKKQKKQGIPCFYADWLAVCDRGSNLLIFKRLSELDIDIMIFFWDPLQPQPHDVDVKALLRIAVVYNIPIAQNRSTADFLISSDLFNESYDRFLADYSKRFSKDI